MTRSARWRRTMNDLLVRVRTSLERERSLVADASHELRTPFAILQGELELAQRPGRTRDELMTTVTVAAEEVARLTRIADDLLLLSRGDQGQLPSCPSWSASATSWKRSWDTQTPGSPSTA